MSRKRYLRLLDPYIGGLPRENIKYLVDSEATLSRMKGSLAWLSNQACIPNSSALLYYSGHGAPSIDSQGNFQEAYLVPYDANAQYIEETGLLLRTIRETTAKIKAEEVFLAFDACFSGKGRSIVKPGTKGIKIVPRRVEDFLGILGKGKAILTASAEDQISTDYKKGGHGLFTYYLLEALKGKADEEANRNGWVEADEVYRYVRNRVKVEARRLNVEQEPQIWGSPQNLKITRNYELLVEQDKSNKIARVKQIYEEGYISASQLEKAIKEIKSDKESKALSDFLKGEISQESFGTIY